MQGMQQKKHKQKYTTQVNSFFINKSASKSDLEVLWLT